MGNRASKEDKLYEAANRGDLVEVQRCLDSGADVNWRNPTIYGFTPLHTASLNGHVDVVKCLVERGANVHATTVDGETPLHTASHKGHVDVVKCLVENGANVRATDEDGETPLHTASHKGHVDVVKCLVENGANVRATTKYGQTPLHWASQNGHIEVVKTLLAAGVDLFAIDQDGKTPRDLAVQNGHTTVVDALDHSAKERALKCFCDGDYAMAEKHATLVITALNLDMSAFAWIGESLHQQYKCTEATAAFDIGYEKDPIDVDCAVGLLKVLLTIQVAEAFTWDDAVRKLAESKDPSIGAFLRSGKSMALFRSVVNNPTLYHDHKEELEPVFNYLKNLTDKEDVGPAPQPQPSPAPFHRNIATLVDLAEHLKSFPATKTWPLMGSFLLLNRPLTTDNHPIFECVDQEQTTLGLVVKLTDERRELDFFEEVCASQQLMWLSADTFLVRCVKWGQVTIESRKCFALVLLRGEANCLDLLGSFQFTSVGRPNRYTCLKKVVAAVKFLHDNGYVHGDIKLENVMKFSGLLDFKLIDFDNTVRIGSPFDAHCSREYCPPEMAHRMRPNHGLQPLIAHPSFDVWCVGVLVLKLFVPMGLLVEFEDLTGQDIIDKIATTGFTFEASLAMVEGLDPAQVQVLKTCLAVDPTVRATVDSILGLVPRAFITQTPGVSNVPSSPVPSPAFSDEKERREDLKGTMEVAKAFRQEDLFARLAQDETMRDQLEDESFVYMVKSLQANPNQFDRRNEGMNRVFQYLQRFSESIVRDPASQPPVLSVQGPCQLPVMWTIRLLTDKTILPIEEQIRGLECRIGVVNTLPSAECSFDELHFVTVSAESEVVALVLPFVRASRVLLDVLDFINAYKVDKSRLTFVVPHADTIEATVNALETIHKATTTLPSETLLRELDTRLIDGDVMKQEVEDICNRVERVVMELGTSFDTIERVTEILDCIAGLQSDKTLTIVGGLVRSGDRSWKCHGHATAT